MADALPIILELSIPRTTDEILNFTKSTLAQILAHKKLDISQQRRIKLILIELVTNSIKHDIDNNSKMMLFIDHPTLTIQKLEKGLKIEFKSSAQQIPFKEIDKTIDIAFSEENKHHIQTLDKYKFRFLNPFTEGLHIEKMPEHFGFYIITLASDSFIYQYDPEKGENRYIIDLNL